MLFYIRLRKNENAEERIRNKETNSVANMIYQSEVQKCQAKISHAAHV